MKILTPLFLLFLFSNCTQKTLPTVQPVGLESAWITAPEFRDSVLPNYWLVFQQTISLREIPEKVISRIAADSKYWLWINDQLVIREGGLKWGPVPNGYYVDELDMAPFLKPGNNKISLAVWYFGKNSFSHVNSGQAGLWLEAEAIGLQTNANWSAAIHPAFIRRTAKPHPNWRLSESNIHYDARQAKRWQQTDPVLFGFDKNWEKAQTFQRPDTLVSKARPIPQWKDFGLRDFSNEMTFPHDSKGDTLIMSLPYNAQITPYFEITAPAGLKVDMRTDNYKGGSEYNLRAEYITTEGRQIFESPAWMNGHELRYHFPKEVVVHALKFRETGYASEFTGHFKCNDTFYNQLWQKALRTLYVTMRDNYMDCPDRERAQWWGDVVLESGETFYAMDRRSDLLTRKAILELMDWQRADSTIFSPIPAGNWGKELPTQMMASVGYYGIWNYYRHTGDIKTIREVYPAIKRYLGIWKTDPLGLVVPRSGGWTWGDWGDHKDLPLIFNGWYYLALQGFEEMAVLTGHEEDRLWARQKMTSLSSAFEKTFWTGKAYRSPQHEGPPDDRSQALAVLTGICPPERYPAMRDILKEHQFASPYFEKYVLEALFVMGYPEDALHRMKARFGPMVDSPITTLWEGWDVGSAKWGGGTYNHAWSGGGLTLLSQYVAGIEPISPGYEKVWIRPQLGPLTYVNCSVDTPLGLLQVKIRKEGEEVRVEADPPDGMELIINAKAP